MCGIGDKSFALYYKEEEGVGVGGRHSSVCHAPRGAARGAGHIWHMSCVFIPLPLARFILSLAFYCSVSDECQKGHGRSSKT